MKVFVVCLAEKYEGFNIEGVFDSNGAACEFIKASLRKRVLRDTESYFYKEYEVNGDYVSTMDVKHTYTLATLEYNVRDEEENI